MKLRVFALALLCATSLHCAQEDSYFNASSKEVFKSILYSACFNLLGGFIERLVNEKTDLDLDPSTQQNMIVLHESEDKKGRISISVELAEKLYVQQHNKNAKHL